MLSWSRMAENQPANSCSIPCSPTDAIPLGARSSAIQKIPSSVNKPATAEGLSSLTACSRHRGRSAMLCQFLVFTLLMPLSPPLDTSPRLRWNNAEWG